MRTNPVTGSGLAELCHERSLPLFTVNALAFRNGNAVPGLPSSLDSHHGKKPGACFQGGRNIKNVTMPAAFLAADQAERVGVNHVLREIDREYRKVGRLMLENS